MAFFEKKEMKRGVGREVVIEMAGKAENESGYESEGIKIIAKTIFTEIQVIFTAKKQSLSYSSKSSLKERVKFKDWF